MGACVLPLVGLVVPMQLQGLGVLGLPSADLPLLLLDSVKALAIILLGAMVGLLHCCVPALMPIPILLLGQPHLSQVPLNILNVAKHQGPVDLIVLVPTRRL